jgi:hypothetical protein
MHLTTSIDPLHAPSAPTAAGGSTLLPCPQTPLWAPFTKHAHASCMHQALRQQHASQLRCPVRTRTNLLQITTKHAQASRMHQALWQQHLAQPLCPVPVNNLVCPPPSLQMLHACTKLFDSSMPVNLDPMFPCTTLSAPTTTKRLHKRPASARHHTAANQPCCPVTVPQQPP